MATHDELGASQPIASTITKRLDAITLNFNSTDCLRECMVIASPETSNALSAVLAAAPKSTDFGLTVRLAGGPSTFTDMPVRVIAPSTYGDGGIFPVKCSTAADLLVRPFPPSTYADCGINRVQNSSAGDLLAKTTPLSTVWASSAGFHFDSSGALQITDVNGGSTLVTVRGDQSSNSSNYISVRVTNGTAFTDAVPYNTHNSTGDFTGSTVQGLPMMLRSGAVAEGSTDHFVTAFGSSDGAQYIIPISSTGETMHSSGTVGSTMFAMHVRQAQPIVSVYAASTAFDGSTEEAIGTSNAATKNYVFAYSITSTCSSNASVRFYDGNTLLWPVQFSSGFGGANLAVTPPAYLFRGTTGSSMSIRTESSNGGISIGISYYTGA